MGIKVHEFTFPSSGVKVFFRQVSPLVSIDVRAAMEKDKPKPPLEEVELAGKMTMQPNEDDPDYIELLEMYDEEVAKKINETYARRARLKFEYDGWEDEVKEYRETIGINLKETDEWIFLTRVISSGNEMRDFYNVLSAVANPTPEAIDAAKDSFSVKS